MIMMMMTVFYFRLPVSLQKYGYIRGYIHIIHISVLVVEKSREFFFFFFFSFCKIEGRPYVYVHVHTVLYVLYTLDPRLMLAFTFIFV